MYIDQCFSRMDIKNDGRILKEQFISVISSEPDLLEIFDFLNKGGKNLFTNEELEKREYDEKLSRRVIKLEKNLKKISEFLQENFPMNNFNQLTENLNNLSPTFSPLHKHSNPKAVSAVIRPLILNLEEEKKHEILSPPIVGRTPRHSYLYSQVHGFERNIQKIVTKLSPEMDYRTKSLENEFEFNFSMTHEHKERLTIESVMPQIHLTTEDNKGKENGYISQVIINNDFEGDESGSFNSNKKANFTFHNIDCRLHLFRNYFYFYHNLFFLINVINFGFMILNFFFKLKLSKIRKKLNCFFILKDIRRRRQRSCQYA